MLENELHGLDAHKLETFATNAADPLADPLTTTLAERNKRYGDLMGHAVITQGIKDVMRASKNWSRLNPDMRESLEMVAHKIGRILNGDPRYKDSWTDIMGYVKLIEETLED